MKSSFLLPLIRDWGLSIGAAIVILITWNACSSCGMRSGAAPDFTLPDLSGSKWTLSESKRMVVLNFWATWCGPCMSEIPEFVEFQEAYPDVEVVGVSLDKRASQSKLAAVVRRKGINYTILHDRSNAVGRKYRVSTLPTTFIVGSDKEIRDSRVGTLTASGLEQLVLAAQSAP